ncbi:retrovirus-related pol polyprotein from transposon TNT 1-94, partial [Tanacetum coccineum]
TSLASNLKRIQVKDTVKEVKDYLNTYWSTGIDISWGSSHVTNVSQLDVKDFSSWKDRFLVYLDGLEPYLLKLLINGSNVLKFPASTPEYVLVKTQKQWSPEYIKHVNHNKRLKSIIISCLPNDIMKSVIKCTTAKSMWNNLILGHEGSSKIRDTKIATLRLKFKAFKALEGEKTQRANNSIKNDSLATLFDKYNYKKGLIDQIYESEKNRFTIQESSSKVLISNTYFQDSDSDVEKYTRSSKEFLADQNVEFHNRAHFANQKRFYKRSGRVGAARKPIDKSNETCFTCGKQGYFQKDCLTNKTSSPSYPSSNKTYNKSMFHINSSTSSHQHNQSVDNGQKDYKVRYKALKAELALLTQKIEDEGVTTVKAFMAIADDEPAIGKTNARSGHWVEITMKKV